MTLYEAPLNTKLVIESVFSGRGLINRMNALGIIPSATIEVIENHGSGPLLVNINNSTVAIGRREATRVFVNIKESN